jgi:hypothetical protein
MPAIVSAIEPSRPGRMIVRTSSPLPISLVLVCTVKNTCIGNAVNACRMEVISSLIQPQSSRRKSLPVARIRSFFMTAWSVSSVSTATASIFGIPSWAAAFSR